MEPKHREESWRAAGLGPCKRSPARTSARPGKRVCPWKMQIDLESKLEISIDPATNDSLANYSENWALNVQPEREFPLICFSEREKAI